MNISHVLSLGSPESLMNNQISKEKGLELQGEALLFSLILGNILGAKQEAKEQGPEGYGIFEDGNLGQDNLEQENLGVGHIGLVQNTPFHTLEQNIYQQTIQNIFPAGKDANSGLNGQHNQDDIVLSRIALSVAQGGIDMESLVEALNKRAYALGEDAQQSNKQINIEKSFLDLVLSVKDIGLQGSKVSISREISSLSPAELDKYIKTLELLRELSGQIRLTDNRNPILSEMAYKGSYVIPQQIQPVEKGNIKQLGAIEAVIGEKNPQVLAKDNLESNANVLRAESKDQIGIKQLEAMSQLNGKEEKAFNEGMLQKSESQLIIPGQHMISKMETTLIGDKTIVRPEIIPIGSGKIWDQVVNLLNRQDLNQVKELSIQLHPADLGKVNFSVRLENGQIHLVIHASENSTANFLQNNLAELRNNLSQSGINCGTLEMGNNGRQQYSSEQEFTNEEDNSPSRFPEEEKTYYPGFVSAMSINGSGSRINLKA